LSDIISIYLHLDGPTFVSALARDNRSFSAKIFHKACSILQGRNLKSPDEIAKLNRLVQKVQDVRQQEAEDEEELGEIPEEFLGTLLLHLSFFIIVDGSSRVLLFGCSPTRVATFLLRQL
jgi:ubiquitin conjugation factor E4 B